MDITDFGNFGFIPPDLAKQMYLSKIKLDALAALAMKKKECRV
ncbi:hypothetical protein [Argonema galeatum]|nr:hypothetical protein [Argonema galeatum]